MKLDASNYGIQHEYDPPGYGAPIEAPYSGVMRRESVRTLSTLAHLTTYLNIFTGFLGPVAAFVIWAVYRNDSPTVAANAMRSVLYQVVWLTAIFVGWSVTFALMTILIGFLLVPVMLLVTLGPFVQATYEAYLAYKGAGRRYV